MGSFRRNTLWQLLQSVSSSGTDLLVLLALSAKLSAEEFGQFTVMLSFAKIISLLCEPRIHEYLIPRIVRAAPRTRRGVWVYARIGLTIELVGNLLALLCSALVFLIVPELLNAQASNIVLFPFAVFFVLSSTLLKFSAIAIFRSLGEVKKSAIIAMVIGTVKLGVLFVALFLLGCNVITVLILLSAIGLCAALMQVSIALIALRSQCGERPTRCANTLRIGNVRRSARQVFANYSMGLLEIAHRELDIQMLAGLINATEAGKYRIAKNLAMILLELLNPIVLMLLPEFSSRVAKRDWSRVHQFAWKASRLLSVIAVVAACIMYLFIPFMVVRLLPTQVESLPLFEIILIGFVATAPLLWAQSLLVSVGRSDRYLLASAVGTVVSLSTALILVPTMGAIGSAISYAGGLLVIGAIAVIFAFAKIRSLASSK